MMREFTSALYELFVKQGLELSKSLLIMSRKPRKNSISSAAAEIYSALENGSLFSNALRLCSFIRFDEVYVSFILLAEKNGDLQSTVKYLKTKLERKAANKKKLIGASIYPLFVILISIVSCFSVGFYIGNIDFKLLVKDTAVFVFCSVAVYLFILKCICDDGLSEAFTAIDFLIKNGIELSEAVGCAVQIAGPSSRTGRFFETARTKLSYGMDLNTAFKSAELKGNSGLLEALYYADTGGSQADLFGRMAAYLESKRESRSSVCFSLIEPLFIVITGAFLLVLLMTFFMPFINDISWI